MSATQTTNSNGTHIVLASSSPRRRHLLDQIGVSYETDPADIDESVRAGEAPEVYTVRMAEEKVQAVAARRSDSRIILGADTTVVLNGRILGKPEDAADARKTLGELAGNTHSVHTAVAVLGIDGVLRSDLNISDVTFAAMDEEWIAAYVETGEPMDKAGSYGIQGWASTQIASVSGSHSSIMGLPLFETARLLASAGLKLPQLPAVAA